MTEHYHKKPAPENEPALDLDFEPEEELGGAAALNEKLKKVRAELEQVKKERQEYLDGWQRCKADSINERKEVQMQANRTAETLREALVHDIIPALDSFDMAAGSETWASVSDSWRTGMERVRQQLLDALASHGIERFGKVGDRFDHTMYEALEERDDLPGESGTVARVIRYGYKSGSRILRPAQVLVKS